jgi:hypothetical protein
VSNPEADNHGEPQASALRWRRVFPGDDVQISMLRRWLECLLPPCSSRDDLISVAVELGTNAVRHTASGSGGQFVVEVTWCMGVEGNAQGRAVWADIPWTGQDIPGQLEIPVGFASATREAELATRSPAMTHPGLMIPHSTASTYQDLPRSLW